MSFRVLLSFIFGLFVVIIYSQFEYGPKFRKIASVDENSPLMDDVLFSKAALNFEILDSISLADMKTNSWNYQTMKFRLEENLNSEDKELRFISQTALIRYNLIKGEDRELQKRLKNIFFNSSRCHSPKNCLFHINLILKLSEKLNTPKLLKVLNLNIKHSPFNYLLREIVRLDDFEFESESEQKYLNYILESAITHIDFSYQLNQPLLQDKEEKPFPKKLTQHFIEQLSGLEAPEFTESEQPNKRYEVSDFIINPNYSMSSLKYISKVWDKRNTILQHYITRLDTKHLSSWFNNSPDKELSLDALKRYYLFEIRLPTRRDFLHVLNFQNKVDKNLISNFETIVETYEEQILEYFQNSLERNLFATKRTGREDVLKIERDLYFQNFSGFSFYGLIHQILVEADLNAKVYEERMIHLHNVKKDKAVYEGHFKYYYTQQKLEESWLKNACFIRREVRKKVTQRMTQAGVFKRTKTISLRSYSIIESPYSKKSHKYSMACKKSKRGMHDYITHIFALKKAVNAGADELLLGTWGSTLISVLGWFGAFRITQAVMKKFLIKSAKKAALFKAGQVPRWSGKWFKNSLKYRVFPFLAVDYAMNSLVMASTRSVVASSIDQSTGKGRSFGKSFWKYLESYTIMYLSIPPVAFFVAKGGNLFNPITNMYNKFKSAAPAKISSKINQNSVYKVSKNKSEKIGSFIKGTIEQVQFNVVASVSFLPVFYVYDVIYYFAKDQKIEPTWEQAEGRLQGAMTWTFVWQVMNNVISRRFSPSNKAIEEKTRGGGTERGRRNDTDGLEGGGAQASSAN